LVIATAQNYTLSKNGYGSKHSHLNAYSLSRPRPGPAARATSDGNLGVFFRSPSSIDLRQKFKMGLRACTGHRVFQKRPESLYGTSANPPKIPRPNAEPQKNETDKNNHPPRKTPVRALRATGPEETERRASERLLSSPVFRAVTQDLLSLSRALGLGANPPKAEPTTNQPNARRTTQKAHARTHAPHPPHADVPYKLSGLFWKTRCPVQALRPLLNFCLKSMLEGGSKKHP
jgi:hypothetical protein